MAKSQKRTAPCVARYKLEDRCHKNKSRHITAAQVKEDFFRLRHDIWYRAGLKKADAKRVAKLVIKGEEEETAFAILELAYHQIQRAPEKQTDMELGDSPS